jgi:hypothetical protein
MKSRLLVVTALATTAALGLAGCSKPKPQPQFDTSLDMKELMGHVVDPGSWAFWHASGEQITAQGSQSNAPTTEEGWEAAESGAAEVAEAGNLLLIPGNARDDTDWPKFAHQLIKAGLDGKAAAEAKDPQRMFTTGAAIYQVCTACHAKYVIPAARAAEDEREKTTPARLVDWPDDVKRMQAAYAKAHTPPPGETDPSNPSDRAGK